ncbi:(Na+)-NQR maturation NqrM [Vibrio stylophorae]
MAIGVIFKRAPIQGSCGGLSQIGVSRVCNCKTSCNAPRLYHIQEPESDTQIVRHINSKTRK